MKFLLFGYYALTYIPRRVGTRESKEVEKERDREKQTSERNSKFMNLVEVITITNILDFCAFLPTNLISHEYLIIIGNFLKSIKISTKNT